MLTDEVCGLMRFASKNSRVGMPNKAEAEMVEMVAWRR